MRRILIDNPISRRFRRSQRGQSIVLLAFAFIALIAFVGLVTDVALLFVRYASLRRAVDAAAIAAAGQIREGTDYGQITVAAQQYIELHGLDPDSVLVETCETDIYQWRQGLGPWKGNPHPESMYPTGDPASPYEPVSANMPETELCSWSNPRKLVRVSAQVKSETTFLSLIGIDTITLEATSVSETAVLDIALVIDTSESMSSDTTQSDLEAVGLSYSLDPALPHDPGDGSMNVRYECAHNPRFTGDMSDPLSNEAWAGCCNDPGTGNVGDGVMQSNGVYLDNGLIWHDVNGNGLYDGAAENGLASNTRRTGSFDKNQSDTYNFTTLVCQPFKDVKDAARAFIKRLDFVRGDRVVFVTFNREGVAYDPDGADTRFRPLIRSESVAIQTLNTKIGVQYNDSGEWNICPKYNNAYNDWIIWYSEKLAGNNPPEPDTRVNSYEAFAGCGNTNIGGGILAANQALTDPLDVRRQAVWVMIVLSDGAANVTDTMSENIPENTYGYYGFCPWWTFCSLQAPTGFISHVDGGYWPEPWPECTSNDGQTEYQKPFCNDNNPDTRHFCLDWTTGEPDPNNPECGVAGHYDADDYAEDMADFAGLIEVAPNKPGNFIAMFSIAFGEDVATAATGAPLLRYIADAGDNGFIDNNLQQDWRDNGVLDNSVPPNELGDVGPCETVTDPTAQCGQYYYASDLNSLNQVFEEIAGRLFTRLSR